jgi:hypothetical protein
VEQIGETMKINLGAKFLESVLKLIGFGGAPIEPGSGAGEYNKVTTSGKIPCLDNQCCNQHPPESGR